MTPEVHPCPPVDGGLASGLTARPVTRFTRLRHAIEDRMLEAGIDERIRMHILGHQIGRERYGQGGT